MDRKVHAGNVVRRDLDSARSVHSSLSALRVFTVGIETKLTLPYCIIVYRRLGAFFLRAMNMSYVTIVLARSASMCPPTS